MAASIDVLCGICEAQHITKYAEHWCPECEEGLCSACRRHHSISKATKSHEIISVENYKKLPPFISNIIQHCTQHNTKYQHYCRQHDQLCCPVCVSVNHRKCEDLLAIQEIISSSKSSALFDNITQSIGDMKINIEKIIQDRKENLVKIQDQRKKIYEQINQEREKINSHMDTLEHRVTTEINTIEQNIKAEIDNVLKVLVKKREGIYQLDKNLKAVEDYASDLQTFLGNKAIEKEVEMEEAHIKSLKSGGSLQQVDLRCSLNTKISDVLCNISSMGSVSVEKSPPSVALKQKEQQAQIMIPLQNRPKSISNIALTLKSELNVRTGSRDNYLRGCIVCPDGKMVFGDAGNKRLVVLNPDGTFDKEMSIPEPSDITLVDDRRIAMTTYTGIKIINLESAKIEKNFDTAGDYGFGVTFNNGFLIYGLAKRGIEKIELSNNNRSAFTEHKMNARWTHITTFDDNIYHSNHNDNTVRAYKMNGKILWKFSDDNILKNPRHLTVDNNGNVYVSSSHTHSIVVISSDGKIARRLPSREDGMTYIHGLFFDKQKNILVRVQHKGSVYMYNIYKFLETILYNNQIKLKKNRKHFKAATFSYS